MKIIAAALMKIVLYLFFAFTLAIYGGYKYFDREGLGLCQKFSEDDQGPLSDTMSSDGKFRAYVNVSACGFMASDIVTTVFIQEPWTWRMVKVFQVAEDPHIDLQWKDNQTLVVEVAGFDGALPKDKIIDGIHIDIEPPKKSVSQEMITPILSPPQKFPLNGR